MSWSVDSELVEEVVAGRPAWRHEPSGVLFRLIPAGEFRMGFSDEELAAVDAIIDDEGIEWYDEDGERSRPTRMVSVDAFLLARHPLTIAQARHFLPGYHDDKYSDEQTVAVLPTLEILEEMLAALPFRLPSEAEWEYAARAGTTTLTYRGNGRPNQATDLLRAFSDEARNTAHENPFGLTAMGSAREVCADAYLPGYRHARDDASPYLGQGPRVGRGGAADISPWQGCGEEALMFSAFRAGVMPDSDFGKIYTGIRPALDYRLHRVDVSLGAE